MRIKRFSGAPTAAAVLAACLPNIITYAGAGRELIVRLTDSIVYNYRDFTSTQEGSLYFTKYDAATSVSATNDLITVKHEKMADWRSNFWVDGTQVKMDMKTVIDIRFNAELDS